MSSHYQSLLIVMVLTGLGWLVVRRHFAPMMPTDEDFARRRNLWLAITFVAFVMPSFWAYAAFAAVGILYGVKRDSNPAALYPLLLIAIPPLEATIPGIFGVHHQRLLTLILLLPMLPRNLRDQTLPGLLKLPTDKIMLAYLALQVILYWPYMAMLPLMRYTLLLFVNTWLPYFVMSRAFATKAEVRDAMACFVLSVIILSPLAIAETRLSSLLYSDFSSNWGIEGLFSNLKRDGTLRAQLASGQPIVLGYQFAVAIGLWFYLQKYIASVFWRGVGICALAIGLALPLSRGPWVGAAAVVAAFILAAPSSLGRYLKWAAVAVMLVGATMLTPWGDKIAGYLPFVGGGDQESITYRTQIVEVSWGLIRESPFFGNPYAKNQMESLRTGEGIIDIVNVYIAFALAYGLVGVALFVGLFASVMVPLLKVAKNVRTDDDSRRLAAGLFASLVGVMVSLAAVSNYLTIPYIYLMIIGFSVSYLRVEATESLTRLRGSLEPAPLFRSGLAGR